MSVLSKVIKHRIMATKTGLQHKHVATMEKISKEQDPASDSTIDKLLATEYKYMQDLDGLCEVQDVLANRKVLPKPTIAVIFTNFKAITRFQRQFLAILESLSSNRKWPDIFVDYEEDFRLYAQYASNLAGGIKVAKDGFDKIITLDNRFVSDFDTFERFLTLPCARVSQYPQLLKVKQPPNEHAQIL